MKRLWRYGEKRSINKNDERTREKQQNKTR